MSDSDDDPKTPAEAVADILECFLDMNILRGYMSNYPVPDKYRNRERWLKAVMREIKRAARMVRVADEEEEEEEESSEEEEEE